MPSLILYIDENIKQSLDQKNLQPIEKTIIEIILHELDATKDNCQITWIKSNILTSDYKIFGEMKFRQKKTRNKNKKENCLKKLAMFYIIILEYLQDCELFPLKMLL